MLCFVGEVHAQTKTLRNFTHTQGKYFEELMTLMEGIDKKRAEEFEDEYLMFWNSPQITPEWRKKIFVMSDMMLKKRMKAFPDFENYLTITRYYLSNYAGGIENFEVWHEIMESLLTKKQNKVRGATMLRVGASLIKDKTIYQSKFIQWKVYPRNQYYAMDPIQKVPIIIFDTLKLACYSKGDSSIIYHTDGVYYPLKGIWKGHGGRIRWYRGGFDTSKVYADVFKYQIKVKSPKFKIDTIAFTHKKYFAEPMLGSFQEKILPNITTARAVYPQFDSFNKRLRIDNIINDIDYDGGFTMHGSKFIGSGSKKEDAFILFKRNDELFLKVAAKSFIIRPDKLSSSLASITFYYDKDSIYHPGLNFKYIKKDNKVTLYRALEGISKTPFYDSYHKLDIHVDNIFWNVDDPKIDFKMIESSTEFPAKFESANYYKEANYYKIQGISEVNPLYRLMKFCQKDSVMDFPVQNYVDHLRMDGTQVRAMLMNLSFQGFVQFDTKRDYVYIKEKVFDYVYARAGKIDFDVIQMGSKIQGRNNASINLLNFDLAIYGIMPIALSDSQSVIIYPYRNRILMHKNRDFDFGGLVRLPRFDYHGKNFSFIYDKFKLEMPIIDSLIIRVPSFTKNKKGRYPLKQVRTVISNMSGELFIDRFDNKSGRIDTLHQYPIFKSTKICYTYYDSKKIQRGVYTRDKFNFELDTFSINSLNDFETEHLALKGTFHTGGVLPDIKQELILMPDYTLGIIVDSPEGGYPLYEGKANTNGRLRMSAKGLTNDGDLTYIESTTVSKQFILMPDSTVAKTTVSFVNDELRGEPQYPKVSAGDIYMRYEPVKDFMKIQKKKSVINMYDGVKFSDKPGTPGTLELNRQEMLGEGKIEFFTCVITSNKFDFKHHDILSDTCDFSLSAKDFSDLDDFSFFSKNVNADINFETMEARFLSNGQGTYFDFPINQYKCFMDRFVWYMDKQELELAKNDQTSKDLAFEEPAFVSVHPKQDSLKFDAPLAKYSMKDFIIRAAQVEHVDAADSRIFPDSGKVNVFPRAKMETLKNCKVLTNTVTKYHKFYEANINITGRKDFKGDGMYDYIDRDKTKQQIYFYNITQDSSKQTYAEGEIFDSSDFKLSENYGYHGLVNIEANDPKLYYDGSFRIYSTCDSLSQSWINFRSELDPKNIYIPIKANPIDSGGYPLSVGLNLTKDTSIAYSSFLTHPLRDDDINVISADGFMFFDKTSREYRVASREKLIFPSTPGNWVSLKNNKCLVTHKGKINFGADLGALKVEAAGNIVHNLEKNTIKMDMMVAIDFFFNDNALKLLAEDLIEDDGLSLHNFERKVYEEALSEFNGKEDGDKLIEQVTLDGMFKRVPDALNKSIVLNDVKMVWDDETHTYKSTGQLGVSNILKKQVNRMVNGKMEIEKKKRNDKLHLYMELTDGSWYYFFYRNGVFQTISSNIAYNKIIQEMKPEDRKLKTKRKEKEFNFTLCSERIKTKFLANF